MKITILVMSVIIGFSILVAITIGVFNTGEGSRLYEEQEYKQLSSIAESKAERVKDFLENRKSDAVFLSESEDIEKIFDEELVNDASLMANKIKNIAEKTRDEIEKYLLGHPDMTVDDLQNDEVFQSIAVQRVGDTGYTLVGDYESEVVRFHTFPTFVDFDYTVFRETSPKLWELLAEGAASGESGGFYPFENPNGEIKDKYQYMFAINVSTLDNAKLFVSSSTYIDEYGGSVQLASRLSAELNSFKTLKGYSNIILINPEGDVIWTANQDNELGTNLITGPYNNSHLSNVFHRARRDLGPGVSDSQDYGPEDELGLYITSPVISINDSTGKRDLKGILVLGLDSQEIINLIETDVGLRSGGEVYIVNKDRNHITPIKFDRHEDNNKEKIISRGISNCFKNYNNVYFKSRGEDITDSPKFSAYNNYAQVPVLGAHQYILESGWCIIAEIEEEEFLEVIPNTNNDMMINLSIDFLLILIISLFLDKFLEIKKLGKKR